MVNQSPLSETEKKFLKLKFDLKEAIENRTIVEAIGPIDK